MKGALIRIAGFFTRNWGLKLLALVLAIIIYHSLKNEVKSNRTNDRTIFQSR